MLLNNGNVVEDQLTATNTCNIDGFIFDHAVQVMIFFGKFVPTLFFVS